MSSEAKVLTAPSSQFSLADFYFPETDDPLQVSPDFLAWRKEVGWALSLCEPVLSTAAEARCTLESGRGSHRVINMSSYGYLGLVRHPKVLAAAKEALDQYGTGACGSPILSGRNLLHSDLEQKLSRLSGKEGVIIFNSGFGGAMGSVATLLRKGDEAVLDERSHVSLVQGAKLSGAKLTFFSHNDAHSLDEALSKERTRRRMIILEGIYSMDGDMADLPSLLEVAGAHKVGVFIDEAHSILATGPHGGGVVEHFGAGSQVGLQYATFSKAFSACGGFASASSDLIAYMRFYADSYGFSCAMPPVVAAGLSAALDVAANEPWRRDRLWENAAYFRTQLHELGVDTGASTTYVIPLMVGSDRALLFELGHALRKRGLFMAAVDYPTVPIDQVRFRASITAGHTRQDLDEALQILADIFVPTMKSKGLIREKQ
jgi:7-keto-8-aminopelargonate synthetase-like enzyme